MTRARGVVGALVAIARRPSLWFTGLVTYRRLVPDRWWQRRPWMPVPDKAVLRFRATTQYGDPEHRLESGDVVAWLRWCKAENQRR